MSMVNINRLMRLIKINLIIHKKNILTTTAAFIVILALLPFHVSGSLDAYNLLLYIGGFMLTNQSFNEMHDKEKAFQYLTLPCANFERFLSKWLVTTVFFSMALLIVFYVFSLLSVFANGVFFHQAVTVFDLTAAPLWLGIGKYIILQSLFLLGAAYFKKNSITKTTLAIGCVFIALAFALFLLSWIICPRCDQVGLIDLISKSFHGLYFIFWIGVAPVSWYLTYQCIVKSEIK